jgi:hypothetical protein
MALVLGHELKRGTPGAGQVLKYFVGHGDQL